MAPIFTGGRMGFGRVDEPSGPTSMLRVELLFEQYSNSYSFSQGSDSSSTLILNPSISYLYVIGCGGGGSSSYRINYDHANGGGGGGASISRITGYQIASPLIGSPILVRTGHGGRTFGGQTSEGGITGGNTVIVLNGNECLSLGGGLGGQPSPGSGVGPPSPGGSVSFPSPGLTRLSPFPANNQATGGSGGSGGVRSVGPSTQGSGSPSPVGGCAGGGGGGAHLTYREGSQGGPSSPVGPISYIIKCTHGAPSSYPITITGTSGGTAPGGFGPGITNPTAADVGLALGGDGYGQDGNTGGGASAGGGIRITGGASPGSTYWGGGGGGVKAYITSPTTQPVIRGAGGAGFIIVIGSSYELVSGVDY